MVYSFLTVVVAGLVVVVCACVGYRLLRWLEFAFSGRVEGFVFASGLGLSLLILLLALLGFIGFLYPAVGWSVLGIFGLAGWPGLRVLSQQSGFSPRDWWRSLSWVGRILVGIAGVYSLVYLLAGLTPPLEGDSLFGYLVLPREYARNHAITVVDHAYGWWHPQNMMVLGSLGYLLWGETLAMTLVSFTMGLLCLLTIYALGKRHFGPAPAVVGAVVFYGMWAVAYINGSGKVDLGWTFFELLAIFAFSIWYFEHDSPLRWLALSGVCLGVALSTKNTALFSILILPLGIVHRLLWQERRRLGVLLRALLVFCLPISLFSFWMLRIYLLTGNPVYPMLHQFFTGQETLNAIPTNHAIGILGYFRTWWDISMGWIAYGMGKPIGPIILVFVPLLGLIRPVNRRLWPILVYCLLTSILWYFGLQRARHFFPGLALLSLASGYVLAVLLKRHLWLGRLAVGLMVVYLLFNLILLGRLQLRPHARLSFVLGLESREQFLSRHLPADGIYPSYDIVCYVRENLPPEARIVAMLNGNGYYIERPLYHSGAFAGGIIHHASRAGDVLTALRAESITHILINQNIVERYRTDARGIDTNSWLNNSDFQSRYMTLEHCSGEQCLYRLMLPTTEVPHAP